jgi:hypothetical protein
VLIGSEAYFLRRFTPDLQELEVVMGDEHISFTSTKIGSLVDVEKSKYVAECTPPFPRSPCA